MPVLDQNRFLSVQETAVLLHVSADTVRTLLRQGDIAGVKVGHQFRIAPDVLRIYLDANVIEAPA